MPGDVVCPFRAKAKLQGYYRSRSSSRSWLVSAWPSDKTHVWGNEREGTQSQQPTKLHFYTLEELHACSFPTFLLHCTPLYSPSHFAKATFPETCRSAQRCILSLSDAWLSSGLSHIPAPFWVVSCVVARALLDYAILGSVYSRLAPHKPQHENYCKNDIRLPLISLSITIADEFVWRRRGTLSGTLPQEFLIVGVMIPAK